MEVITNNKIANLTNFDFKLFNIKDSSYENGIVSFEILSKQCYFLERMDYSDDVGMRDYDLEKYDELSEQGYGNISLTLVGYNISCDIDIIDDFPGYILINQSNVDVIYYRYKNPSILKANSIYKYEYSKDVVESVTCQDKDFERYLHCELSDRRFGLRIFFK